MITPEQIRAARALLKLEEEELARRANVSIATIRRLEAGNRARRVAHTTIDAVRRALEEAGAEFVEDGVRRRPQRPANDGAAIRDVMAIAERSTARPILDPDFSEDDLYDERGLPR